MKTHYNIIVVGNGLFGALAAKELSKKCSVLCVSDDRQHTGTAAAACLVRPSWLSSLSREERTVSLELLERHVVLHPIPALLHSPVNLVSKSIGDLTWIDPREVVKPSEKVSYKRGVVTKVTYFAGRPSVVMATGEEFTGDHVVLATGAWANMLCKTSVPVYAKAGVTFTWRPTDAWLKAEKQALGELKAHITPWAPYKQTITFYRGYDVWSSDGTALLPGREEIIPETRIGISRRRCADKVGSLKLDSTIVGLRPYSSKPYVCESPGRNVWVITGGAKNGVIAGALCAHLLKERLK